MYQVSTWCVSVIFGLRTDAQESFTKKESTPTLRAFRQAMKKLINKFIIQVSGANPDSNRKHEHPVFTICHLYIKDVNWIKGLEEGRQNGAKEKIMTRIKGLHLSKLFLFVSTGSIPPLIKVLLADVSQPRKKQLYSHFYNSLGRTVTSLSHSLV